MRKPKQIVVLVVDDSDAQRYAMARGLRMAGFQTIEAATGTEALKLADGHPDLILLDVGLPDISGIEVCRILKLHGKTKRIPIIQVSATHRLENLRFEPMKAGADMYLDSSIELDQLVLTIGSMIERHSKPRRGGKRTLCARSTKD
jgi:CheY-like chemotaxis protein